MTDETEIKRLLQGYMDMITDSKVTELVVAQDDSQTYFANGAAMSVTLAIIASQFMEALGGPEDFVQLDDAKKRYDHIGEHAFDPDVLTLSLALLSKDPDFGSAWRSFLQGAIDFTDYIACNRDELFVAASSMLGIDDDQVH